MPTSKAARPNVARAKLNLDYATIRAPIDGVVGAALVSEGALAVQNETNLATHPAARSDLCRLHPVGDRAQPAPPRLRERRPRAHRGRCRQGAPRARRRHALFARRQAAVLRRQGRCPYRAGDVARRIPQSEARAAAGHVCPRPDRAGHRQRRDRGAAAGDPAQWRRRQRGVRRQGRQPHRRAAGAHRIGAGRHLVRHRGPEGRRQGRGRRLPEVRRRRQGQAAILVGSGRHRGQSARRRS